jgi:hypothetical protein
VSGKRNLTILKGKALAVLNKQLIILNFRQQNVFCRSPNLNVSTPPSQIAMNFKPMD